LEEVDSEMALEEHHKALVDLALEIEAKDHFSAVKDIIIMVIEEEEDLKVVGEVYLVAIHFKLKSMVKIIRQIKRQPVILG
jgi:hypothetical protein